jgi:hypothetical protein
MISKSHFAVALTAALVLGVAGCAGKSGGGAATSPETARLTQARAKLDSDIAACTAQHGYDPRNAGIVVENVIAPGELGWADCAYAAARNYARVNSALRLDYELLISEHRKLTEGIRTGTTTRSERRAAIESRLADIHAKEQAQLQAAEASAAADQQQLRNTVETMRGFGM